MAFGKRWNGIWAVRPSSRLIEARRSLQNRYALFASHLSILQRIWKAPGNAANRPLALIRAFRWFMACHFKSVSEDRPVLFPAYGDRIYPCYTDSIVARDVMYRSEWFDYDLLHFMHAFLQADDHFLDVGANTGLHTLLASTRITSGHITCVEPDPVNLARLRRLMDLNHIENATVLEVAASDVSGRVPLVGTDVFTRIAPAAAVTGTSSRMMETARLDVLLGDVARMDYCKIDVEGAEWQVLRGMTGLMRRGALPVVVFELNGSLHAYGHREEEFLGWLRDQGYHLGHYTHQGRTLRLGPPFADDVFAFTTEGLENARARIPGLTIHK